MCRNPCVEFPLEQTCVNASTYTGWSRQYGELSSRHSNPDTDTSSLSVGDMDATGQAIEVAGFAVQLLWVPRIFAWMVSSLRYFGSMCCFRIQSLSNLGSMLMLPRTKSVSWEVSRMHDGSMGSTSSMLAIFSMSSISSLAKLVKMGKLATP